jgi:hypothetical protein
VTTRKTLRMLTFFFAQRDIVLLPMDLQTSHVA